MTSALPTGGHHHAVSAALPDRPHWLPWSAFPFQCRFAEVGGQPIHYIDEGSGPALLFVSAGQWSFMFRDVIVHLRDRFRCLTLDFPGSGLSPAVPGHDHSVPANAALLKGFIDSLDLQDITLAVHDVGGPVGFLAAAGQPGRIRALVITNTFGWPLAGYPAVRRMLKLVSGRPFGVLNSLTNVTARFTATSYGVGRHMSGADRRSFRGPWRSRASRRATLEVLAGVLRIDPIMAEVERSLCLSFPDQLCCLLSVCPGARLAHRTPDGGRSCARRFHRDDIVDAWSRHTLGNVGNPLHVAKMDWRGIPHMAWHQAMARRRAR